MKKQLMITVITAILLISSIVLADDVIVQEYTMVKPFTSYSCTTDSECVILLNITNGFCLDGLCYIGLEGSFPESEMQYSLPTNLVIFLVIFFIFIVISYKGGKKSSINRPYEIKL